MRYCIIMVLIFLFASASRASTIKVPGDYPTIQQAIDASVDGDTVLVALGTYVENIDYLGKAITVKSSDWPPVTIIDGGQAGSVVTFSNGEGLDSVLDGFTITNGSNLRGGGTDSSYSNFTATNHIITGNHASEKGGGIMCYFSSPHIINNTISNNLLDSFGTAGGGICCDSSSPLIENNIISENTGIIWDTLSGGGIYIQKKTGSAPLIINNYIAGNIAGQGGGIWTGGYSTIINNVFEGNVADIGGGGIWCHGSTFVISNNTFIANIVTGNYNSGGGAIICQYYCTTTIMNSIFWDNYANEGPEIWIDDDAIVNIDHSDVKGGKASIFIEPGGVLNWGPGMIDSDPLFTTGPEGDFYLSQIAAGQIINSPCVDAGSDVAGNLGMDTCWTRTDEVPDSGLVDMGFHYGLFTLPKLWVDFPFISEFKGGVIRFILNAETDNANRNYLLLGGLTGTDPGIPLPGGKATLPLNWDLFTNLAISLINTPAFSNFMGKLDGTGSATATFDTLGPLPSGSAGLTLYFAYALNSPWDFASNPINIEVLP